ncbi:MAG: hypothetical protein ACYTFT_00310 [Planctomycetota bacterium]|jgi:hypothetical protein
MFLKRSVPVAIAFVTGLWFALAFYIPTDFANDTVTRGANWVKILTGFASILGLYSLVHLHWGRIRRQTPGWGYSALVYLGLLITVFVGLIGEVDKVIGLAGVSSSMGSFQDYGGGNQFTSGFTWVEQYIYAPSLSAMFSLLAFFIASAAYRTFRARSWQAAVLLVAAVIVMFGQVPLAAMVSERIPELADWLMLFPNMAAKRGIMLGVALGIIATALRIIFGIERAYLGGE